MIYRGLGYKVGGNFWHEIAEGVQGAAPVWQEKIGLKPVGKLLDLILLQKRDFPINIM
jgi:hypothetical protein